MTRGAKPTGKAWFDLLLATFEFVELAAIVALEMMMMFFAGDLVTRRVTRNLDCSQPAILDQRFDVAINGGNAQTAVMLLCGG